MDAASALEVLTAPGSLLSLLLTLSQPIQLLLPTLVLASARPRRTNFARRATALGLGWVIAVLALTPASYVCLVALNSELASSLYSLASSLAMLVCAIPTACALFELSAWQALFCTGAGYTVQNLASGLSEFINLLVHRLLGIPMSMTDSVVFGLSENAALVQTVSIGSYVVIYALFHALYVQRIRRRGLTEVEDHKMMAVLVLVMLAVIAFDVVIKSLDAQGAALGSLVMLRLVHGTVCLFVLFVQYEMLYSKSLEAEVATERRMAAERERQYQISRENIEAINVKCHDIRHQIHRLADGGADVDAQALTDIEREVAVYDSAVRTGHEALDTILTEKRLVCEREDITLSCIADGAALRGLEPAEIYAFFGNALDNAIRAVRALDEPELRSISLTVRRAGTLAVVHVENYCAADTVCFAESGLPETTQEGPDHGFGTRSMRALVERHGGTLAFDLCGNVFAVNAVIPEA